MAAMVLNWELICLAGLGVGFGAYALYLGYDSVTIGAVFALLGSIGGYLYGKKTKEKG